MSTRTRKSAAVETLGILAVGGLAAILGCMVPGDGEGLDEQGQPLPPRPAIAYPTPVTDTVGYVASHSPVSSGGLIEGYSVSPTLPNGLILDPTNGVIAGSPAFPAAAQDFTVRATGPGGFGSAVIRIAVSDHPCVLDSTLPMCNVKPEISYPTPVTDTVTRPASHAPVFSGRITTYTLSGAALPGGLSLNPSTGVIGGTPTDSALAQDYTVIAVGPGGGDTATINITVRAADSCMLNPNLLGCPVPPLYFNNMIQGPIFQTYCTSCHAPGGSGFTATGLNLNSGASYDSLVNKPAFEYPQMMRVRPGLPDSSYLYLKISTPDGQLPIGTATRMPLALPALNPALILRVQRWIAAGAPRN